IARTSAPNGPSGSRGRCRTGPTRSTRRARTGSREATSSMAARSGLPAIAARYETAARPVARPWLLLGDGRVGAAPPLAAVATRPMRYVAVVWEELRRRDAWPSTGRRLHLEPLGLTEQGELRCARLARHGEHVEPPCRLREERPEAAGVDGDDGADAASDRHGDRPRALDAAADLERGPAAVEADRAVSRHAARGSPEQPPERPDAEERRPRLVRSEQGELLGEVGVAPREDVAKRRRDPLAGGLQHADLVLLRPARGEHRAAVRAPGDAHAEHRRDRRQDVHRRHVLPDRPAAGLVRQLHEEWDEGVVLEVSRPHRPALVTRVEADALVRGDDHERAVPEARLTKPRNEPPEQPVRERELQEVALPVLDDLALVLRPELARRPRRHRVAQRVARPVRQVLPRAVR